MKALKIIAAVLLVLVVGVVLLIAFFDWNWLKGPITAFGSDRTGRKVEILGDIDVPHLSWTPLVSFKRVRLGNPDWAKDENLAEIEELRFRIDIKALLGGTVKLPEVDLIGPDIRLLKDAEGRKNWDFSSVGTVDATLPDDRTDVPVVDHIAIENGRLRYDDAPAGFSLEADVGTLEGERGAGSGKIQIAGKGTLQGAAFDLDVTAGSIEALRSGAAPYPVDFSFEIGETRAKGSGQIADPVLFDGIDMTVAIAGSNAERLYDYFNILAPATPPYRLQGHLIGNDGVWRFESFDGTIGNSDLAGDIVFDNSGERLHISGDMHSKEVDFIDIGPLIGVSEQTYAEARAEEDIPAEGEQQTAEPDGAEEDEDPYILPDAPLRIEGVRSVDADVKYAVDRIVAPDAEWGNVLVNVKIDDGVLALDPLTADFAGGRIESVVTINAQDRPVVTDYDIAVVKARLERVVARAGLEADASGDFHLRLKLTGRGDSVRESLGSSDGRVVLAVGDGNLSALIVELAGLDVGESLLLVLSDDTQDTTALRCGIGILDVAKGVMTLKNFVLDTADANVTGAGTIDLGEELVDTRFQAHPKDPSILSIGSPVHIQGRLSGVDWSISLPEVIEEMPFVSLGLANDNDCSGMIAYAEKAAADPSMPVGAEAAEGSDENSDGAGDE
ncbi:MAG: hypothetical protein CMM50_01270 [Rhodospirillaceae bacterium]|nr:hypothetical protein [Rhodospirillaceae bacterium]